MDLNQHPYYHQTKLDILENSITEDLEKIILENLIFPETIDNLIEDTKIKKHILQDVIKQLIKKGLVCTVLDLSLTSAAEIYYDSDHMDSYMYKISVLGLKALGL